MPVSTKQERVVQRGASPPPTPKGAFQAWVDAYGRAWRRGMPAEALGGGDGAAGMTRLARELGCAPMTVQYWYYRQGPPKSAWLREILRLAGGALTFDDIIDSTRKIDDDAPAKKKKSPKRN